jgi:hypothetical protein
MNFQEFLASKRALAIVEHMQTLSEADARELFESLDDATVELIEQLLGEGILGTVVGGVKKGVDKLKQMDKNAGDWLEKKAAQNRDNPGPVMRKVQGVVRGTLGNKLSNKLANWAQRKEALEIIDLASTLSESQAIELFEGLDDSMIALVEQLLGEVTAGTLKKVERRSGTFSPAASAARTSYYNRDRTSTPPNWMFRNQDGGFKGLPPTPSKIGQNRIARQRDERTSGSESGQSETREPASELKMRRLRSTTPERVRLNLRAFRQGTQASKYPTQKEALEIIDLASTLSESQAIELFEGLDDSMIALVEQLLNENLPRDPVTKQPIFGKTGVRAFEFSHKNRSKGQQPPEDIGDADSGSVPAGTPREARKQVAAFGKPYKREVDAGQIQVQPNVRSNPVKFKGVSRLEKKNFTKSGKPSDMLSDRPIFYSERKP